MPVLNIFGPRPEKREDDEWNKSDEQWLTN